MARLGAHVCLKRLMTFKLDDQLDISEQVIRTPANTYLLFVPVIVNQDRQNKEIFTYYHVLHRYHLSIDIYTNYFTYTRDARHKYYLIRRSVLATVDKVNLSITATDSGWHANLTIDNINIFSKYTNDDVWQCYKKFMTDIENIKTLLYKNQSIL